MNRKIVASILFISTAYLYSCQSKTDHKDKTSDTLGKITVNSTAGKTASASIILARPQVPILCYHQIRNWREKDSKSAREIIVPIALFQAQLKMLADSGYHTILPDELYNYLNNGAKLPEKPIMLTFDDNDLDQYTVAAPEMKKYGFKGVFFIMTVI